MPDPLFPVTQDVRQQWDIYLNQRAPVSQEMDAWRRGTLSATPLQSVRALPTPTPHPLHEEYSSIETARMRKSEYERNRRVTYIRIRGVETRAPWLPPEQDVFLMSWRPNINRFNGVIKMRIPKGLY